MTRRAIVLGGGGPVGIAWEVGLLAGMLEAGCDVRNADYVLGTSAGSFVGSQLAAGRDMRQTYEAILAEERRQSSAADQGHRTPPGGARPAGSGGPPPMTRLMQLMTEAAGGQRDAKEVRQELGRFSLEADTVSEETFIKSFGRGLSEAAAGAWPKGFACTAVDTASGDFQVWDEAAGVDLARAVASSCSVPGVFPPITINGRRWMDGGMRSGTNADLPTGYDKVLVVAVRTNNGDAAALERSKAALDREIQVVKDSGAAVGLIVPDEASATAFGLNLMDARRRPAAARAGYEQGLRTGPLVKPEWD